MLMMLLVLKWIQKLFYFILKDFSGTADAISFRNSVLRIHDLKTGIRPVHIEQLEIYAALFCLEYKIKPSDIKIELRIYQNDEILVHEPEATDIIEIMEKIVHLNKLLENIERGE
jgi:hypothetical protein